MAIVEGKLGTTEKAESADNSRARLWTGSDKSVATMSTVSAAPAEQVICASPCKLCSLCLLLIDVAGGGEAQCTRCSARLGSSGARGRKGFTFKTRSPKLPCAHPTKTIDRRIIESSVVIFK